MHLDRNSVRDMKIIRKTDPVADAIMALHLAKQAADEASMAERDARKTLERVLTESQLKKAVVRDGDKKYTASYVTPEPKVVIDEKGLLAALSARDVTKITNKVLDRKKLEELMDKNESVNDIAVGFMTLKDSPTYIRYTEGVNDDLEGIEDADA